MSYQTDLQNNNTKLQTILNEVNNPTSSGIFESVSVTINASNGSSYSYLVSFFDKTGNPINLNSTGGTYDVAGGIIKYHPHTSISATGDYVADTGSRTYIFKSDGGTFTAEYYYSCLIGSTLVLIDLDGNTKPIETFKEGDSVVSYNIETGENYLAKVTKLIVNEHSTELVKITLDNETVLEMTPVHPIYTTNGFCAVDPWNDFKQLNVKDIVKTINGDYEIINIERYTLDEPIKTYTLAITDYNENPDNDIYDNFYANGVIVHNKAS